MPPIPPRPALEELDEPSPDMPPRPPRPPLLEELDGPPIPMPPLPPRPPPDELDEDELVISEPPAPPEPPEPELELLVVTQHSGQAGQLSPRSHTRSPHTVGQRPQSIEHVMQLSPAPGLQMVSPHPPPWQTSPAQLTPGPHSQPVLFV